MYKEKIANLLTAIDQRYQRGTKARDKALDVVEMALELFSRCASSTYSKAVPMEITRMQVNAETYAGMAQDLNDSNTWMFSAMINAMQNVNDLCVELGVAKIYDGLMDMESMEMFCGAVMKEYFDGRSL